MGSNNNGNNNNKRTPAEDNYAAMGWFMQLNRGPAVRFKESRTLRPELSLVYDIHGEIVKIPDFAHKKWYEKVKLIGALMRLYELNYLEEMLGVCYYIPHSVLQAEFERGFIPNASNLNDLYGACKNFSTRFEAPQPTDRFAVFEGINKDVVRSLQSDMRGRLRNTPSVPLSAMKSSAPGARPHMPAVLPPPSDDAMSDRRSLIPARSEDSHRSGVPSANRPQEPNPDEDLESPIPKKSRRFSRKQLRSGPDALPSGSSHDSPSTPHDEYNEVSDLFGDIKMADKDAVPTGSGDDPISL